MKKLPTDPEAERVCIGAALARQDALDLIIDQLEQSYFYDNRHKHIWTALHEFWRTGQRPDVVDVAEHLQHHKNLERAGGMSYLMGIENEGRGCNMPLYIERVRVSHKRRSLIAMAQHLLNRAGEDDLDDILDDTSRELSNISALSEEKAQFLEELFLGDKGLLEQYRQAARDRRLGHTVMAGVPTGMTEIDGMLGGLAPTRFIVIGACTGVGKTEFMSQLLAQHARDGVKALVFSMEMDAKEYASRVGGPLIRVHGNRSLSGDVSPEEEARYDEMAKNLKAQWNSNILIYAKAAIKTQQIKAITRRYMEQHGIKVVYIDHMGLIKSNGRGRYEQMSEISRDLKELAMSLNVCVVAACQMNREGAKEGDLELYHLRDSGNIEQDVNQAVFLMREQQGDDPRSIWKVKVAKNRHGPKHHKGQAIKYFYDYRSAYLHPYVEVEEEIGDDWGNFTP